MDTKKIALVVFALMLLIALVFATNFNANVTASDILGNSLVAEQGKSIAFYLKTLNSKILSDVPQAPEKIVPSAPLVTAPQPSASAGGASNTLSAPGTPVVSPSGFVSVDTKSVPGFYKVTFAPNYKDTDLFCVIIDPTLLPSTLKADVTKNASVCFQNPTENKLFNNEVSVSLHYISLDGQNPKTYLDCYYGAWMVWRPGADEQVSCEYDALSPVIADLVKLRSKDKILCENGSCVMTVQVAVKDKTYPANSGAGLTSSTDSKTFFFSPQFPGDVSYSFQDSIVGMSFFIVEDSVASQYLAVNELGQTFDLKKVGTNLYRVLLGHVGETYTAVQKSSTSNLPQINSFLKITSSLKGKTWAEGDLFQVDYSKNGKGYSYNAKVNSSGKFVPSVSANDVFSVNSQTSISLGSTGVDSINVIIEPYSDKIIVKSITMNK